MTRLTFIAALGILAGCSTQGWRAQRVDGSSPSAFEGSIASLQQQLPPRRRADLDTALAVIWMRDTTAGAGDVDSDGRVDVDEIRTLQTAAEEVLTDISRGVFASSIQEHGAAAGYVTKLDGLGYDDIIALAAATDGDVFTDAVRREADAARCSEWHRHVGSSTQWGGEPPTAFTSRYCGRRR